MTLQLRDYQLEMLDRARDEIRAGHRAVLVQAPTGSGKTALASTMIGNAIERKHRVWFVVHRRELLRQSVDALVNYGLPRPGVVAGQAPMDIVAPIQVCSVMTLARRLDRLPPPTMIVWDEAHHLAAGTWKKVFQRHRKVLHVGLTATPTRLDGRGLSGFFTALVDGPSPSWLIENGWLSPFRYFSVPSFTVDPAAVRSAGSDFNREDLVEQLSGSTITGDAVSHYLKYAAGRRAIAFEVLVERSQKLAARFREAGVPAAHVDADTPANERDRAMAELKAGKLKVLCNVDLFGEGVDVPTVEAVILCRPTQSLTLYLQQVGRGLRPAPGKDCCIILDHVGNIDRHGSPDSDREWSLHGKEQGKRKESDGGGVRQCRECLAMSPASMEKCLYCGEPFVKAARIINEEEGQLTEIDVARMRKVAKREQAMAQDLDALINLGRMRGYKRPETWARYVLQARQLKREKRA